MSAPRTKEIDQTDEAAAWAAVANRDRRFDGAFVYAVRTTGVYCRPSCPSRRPHRANVIFYRTRSSAEAAGFRACLRCKGAPAIGEETVR
ncbi:MAG: Ada metal-binding domain-containing protein [Gemmatimonadaceae bacterium]